MKNYVTINNNDVITKAKSFGRRTVSNVRRFLSDESGMGTVEVILIIVEIYTYKRYVYPVSSIP